MIRDWSTKKEYEQKRKKKKRKLYLAILTVLVLGGGYFWLSHFFLRPEEKIEIENEEIKEQEPPPPARTEGKRKNIYDRHMRELAVSFKVSSVYVKPLEFDNIEKTVARLAEVLELDGQSLLDELKAQRSFKWLVENILEEKAREIADLNLSGVYLYEQQGRFYPEGARVANIIGEVKDEHGLSGVEGYYDTFLRYNPVKKGNGNGESHRGLVLTIDAKMQALLGKEMKALHTMTEAGDKEVVFSSKQTVVNALVMDVVNGEILADVQFPPLEHAGLGLDDRDDGRDPLLEVPLNPGRLSMLFKVAAAYNRGEKFLSGEEELPDNVKILYPGYIKKMRKKQKTAQWSRMADGSYTSLWLANALSTEEEETLEGHNEFFSMQDFIEQGGPCTVDLPGENGGGDTGLGLLCGVAALVNGGKSITPHFFKGFLSENGDLLEWKWPEQGKKIVGPEASRKFIRFLQESVGAASSMMVGEVISSPANVTFPNDKGLENQKEEDKEITPPVIDDCNAIVLATAPLRNPELAMVLTLEQGRIDLGEPSPLRQKTEEFLKKALRLHRQKKSSKAKHTYTAEDYRKWLLERDQLPGSGKTEHVAENGRMQDVRGMSLRKALQLLEKNNVKVMIEGSGRVKNQHPAPGSKLTKNTVVVLKAEVVK